MRIFLICPVRAVTPEEMKLMDEYVFQLEARNHAVYWPPRDTDQAQSELKINEVHRYEITKADEVHVWWNPTSLGSHFDLGQAFALGKRLVIANVIQRTPNKTYNNFLLAVNGREV